MRQTPIATKFPLADVSSDAKTAAYIAVLERKLQYQETMMLQYRALLEALTGEQYEEIDTRLSADGFSKTAATAFERNMARDLQQAERIVEANLASANASSEPL